MLDDYRRQPTSLHDPAVDGVEVIPSNDPLPRVARALYIGGEGDLQITLPGFEGKPVTLTFRNLQGSTVYPFRCTHVLPGATTATNIVAIW